MATTINLGNEPLVRLLYSYPNNANEVGFLNQTLEQTIETWFKSTVSRDALNLTASVSVQSGQVHLNLSGADEAAYAAVLPAYLKAGAVALKASVGVNAAKKWLYNWRSFAARTRDGAAPQRAVAALSADYVLERDQDYLLAHTTTRWAELLVENGADPASSAQYQTIVDIAPVAAPSDAGRQLEGIYSSYSEYINALLALWLPKADGSIRPMVAFGSPVKQWLKTVYGLDLPVLQQKVLKLANGTSVNVLGANHPSFIYNAAKQQAGEPTQTPDQLLQRAMRIMQQDSIAARWQVAMAANPGADPAKALADATAFWSDPAKHGRVCELTHMQVFNTSEPDAKKLCAALPHPLLHAIGKQPAPLAALDAEIDALRERLDGREPDKIPDA